MWVRVGFGVQGDQQVSRAFEATEIEARDLSEPLGRMADVILQSVRDQFDTEGAHGLGGRWQPLSDAYAAWKERHWPGRAILVRDGGMKGAMLNRAQAVTVTPGRMLYEPRSRIAGWHQAGADWVQDGTARHLPARPMVKLTEQDKREAVDRVFTEWLNHLRRGPLWNL